MARRISYKLFGIIGCPVEHSLSPYMHNAAFNRLKITAAYLPFSVKKNKLKEAISSLRENGISGFNVTIPFKSECIKYLDKVEPIAKMIGAVNTVVVRKGKFIGYNTDYLGFIRSLKEELGFNPKEKSIFILGAGGVSKAVAFGLAREGSREIYIYDIVQSKAKLLAQNIRRYFSNCKVVSCTKKEVPKHIKDCQLLVNCTPLGMSKNDPLPIDARLLHKRLKVYDIVYVPLKTSLINVARQKGIKAVGGLGMLLYQGTCAFQLWTKKRAPISLMRKELLDNLRC